MSRQTTLTDNGTHTFPDTTPGKEFAFTVAGTWDSGTVTLKWSDGTNDVAFPDGVFTADGGIVVTSPHRKIKAVLAGATSPSLIVSLEPLFP